MAPLSPLLRDSGDTAPGPGGAAGALPGPAPGPRVAFVSPNRPWMIRCPAPTHAPSYELGFRTVA